MHVASKHAQRRLIVVGLESQLSVTFDVKLGELVIVTARLLLHPRHHAVSVPVAVPVRWSQIPEV